jgi:L-fuculose-phosphate aldolase
MIRRMDSSWLHPRDELVATMARIYRYRMTTTSGGNLSILDPDGSIWITPSRVDKGGLTARDVVRVRPDGTREGLHPPSSEFPFHQAIYRRRPDLRAIVHAHPGALVAFSICRQLPDTACRPTPSPSAAASPMRPMPVPAARNSARRSPRPLRPAPTA